MVVDRTIGGHRQSRRLRPFEYTAGLPRSGNAGCRFERTRLQERRRRHELGCIQSGVARRCGPGDRDRPEDADDRLGRYRWRGHVPQHRRRRFLDLALNRARRAVRPRNRDRSGHHDDALGRHRFERLQVHRRRRILERSSRRIRRPPARTRGERDRREPVEPFHRLRRYRRGRLQDRQRRIVMGPHGEHRSQEHHLAGDRPRDSDDPLLDGRQRERLPHQAGQQLGAEEQWLRILPGSKRHRSRSVESEYRVRRIRRWSLEGDRCGWLAHLGFREIGLPERHQPECGRRSARRTGHPGGGQLRRRCLPQHKRLDFVGPFELGTERNRHRHRRDRPCRTLGGRRRGGEYVLRGCLWLSGCRKLLDPEPGRALREAPRDRDRPDEYRGPLRRPRLPERRLEID